MLAAPRALTRACARGGKREPERVSGRTRRGGASKPLTRSGDDVGIMRDDMQTLPSTEPEDLGEADEAPIETRLPLEIVPKSFSIFELHRRWKSGELKLQPDYQRELVWAEDKQIKLVESVLARIPLPVFYLSEGEILEVVDGQQRLTTLFAFIEGRFADKHVEGAIRRRNEDLGEGRPFELRKLTLMKEHEGQRFDTLHPKARRRFEDTQLTCFVLGGETSPQAKFQIFGRLNEGTTPLNPQEIRNAIYRGPGLDLVRELAGPDSRFREVAGATRSYARMRADELVLRGIAFSWLGHADYRGDLKGFLNDSLEKLNRASDQQRDEVRRMFLHAIDFAERVFAEGAWQRYDELRGWSGHISGPLVEVVSAGATRVFPDVLPTSEQASKIQTEFKTLCGDPAFTSAILTATQTVANVSIRMNAFERICRSAR